MKTSRAYKTELDPTNKQASIFWRHVGTARYVYNWGLSEMVDAYDREGSLSWIDENIPTIIDGVKILNGPYCRKVNGNVLSSEFTKYKKRKENVWLKEISSRTEFAEIRDLDKAFQNFFRRVKNGGRPGYPKFKRRGGHSSFHAEYQSIKIDHDRVRLSKIGWVRLKEHGYLPTDLHVNSVTISERAGHWFISVQVDDDIACVTSQGDRCVVGVDIGVTNNITLSNGVMYPNPKALDKNLKKLRKLNKELSRRVMGSSNREKTRKKLAELHYHIHCIRKDHIHKVVHDVCQKYTDIFVEDFSVVSVVENAEGGSTARRGIYDSSMGMLREIIKYKGPWMGKKVYMVKVDENFSSNRMCSRCGHVQPEPVKNKRFKCPQCYHVELRQVNTGHNLMTVASSLEETLNACGDGSSPHGAGDVLETVVHGHTVKVKVCGAVSHGGTATVKQELGCVT